ncbi:MAG: hypothetical protein H6825_13005 [Planctomycetes bacterium]|nr:hypothetical protein [Planctomycetota bacterium]
MTSRDDDVPADDRDIDAERAREAGADRDPQDPLVALSAAWTHLRAPRHDARVDDESPSDAGERAARRWLAAAIARLPVPDFDRAADATPARDEDAPVDAATRATLDWMAEAWTRVRPPRPSMLRASPLSSRPRLLPDEPRAGLGWRRVAAAALVLLALGLLLNTRDRQAAAPGTSGPVAVDGGPRPTDLAPSGERVAADAHASPVAAAEARAEGLPWRGAPPTLASADRIESRAGRVRLVLLTSPPP